MNYFSYKMMFDNYKRISQTSYINDALYTLDGKEYWVETSKTYYALMYRDTKEPKIDYCIDTSELGIGMYKQDREILAFKLHKNSRISDIKLFIEKFPNANLDKLYSFCGKSIVECRKNKGNEEMQGIVVKYYQNIIAMIEGNNRVRNELDGYCK